MPFEPFQKVLVCNGPGDIWQKAFYDRRVESHYGYIHAVVGDKQHFKYCIPYDKDNDLSGTLVLKEPYETESAHT